METAVRHRRESGRRGRAAHPASRARGVRRAGGIRLGIVRGLLHPAASMSTLQLAVYMVLAVVAITFYVGHVHATEAMMAEAQTARQENLRLHLAGNQLKGDFDRLTGPSVVMGRARELGLVEGFRYGQPIVVLHSE